METYRLREVIIEITNQCNLRCLHCGSGCENKEIINELSVTDWKKVLIKLSEMRVEKIVFSGGEPTLKKGFGGLLELTSGLGMKVGFISNGLLKFSNILQESINISKPFAVGLSIDGLKETHNKIRRNEKSWQGVMKNISILQKMDVQICAVTTLNEINFHELSRLASFLNAIEIDSWQLQLAMPLGRMKERMELLIDEINFRLICEEIEYLRGLFPNLNIQAADCFGLAPENSVRSDLWNGCTAGISSMAIDSQGRIMPCLSLQGCREEENVKEANIQKIWNESSVFDFNRKFIIENVEGRCKKCEFLKNCRGGCNSQSFSFYGYYHSSPFCYMRTFN